MRKGWLCLLCVCLPLSAHAVPYWGPEEQITNSSSWAQINGAVASRDRSMHLLTLDNRTGLPAVYYQRRDQGQKIWTTHIVLSNETGGIQAGDAGIGTDVAGNICAVWEEYYGGNIRLYFRRSMDIGRSWSLAVLVAGAASTTAQAKDPDLVIDGNNTMHLVWLDEAGQ